jgi:hypothetical protein
MRKATVEIDKVTGTAWPPERVNHRGTEHSLESVYEQAGLQLTVIRDQGDLPLPAAGPNFDLAQLHEYMTRHRKPERAGWYAHILIVPNIEYAESWSISRPLGVMYDFRSTDVNNLPREGCAMSMRAVAHDGRVYLRTLAHELGHVFNLLHPKHEVPPQPIGTTLMNQTVDLQTLGAFPANIEYDFSEANRDWLRTGPPEFVMPGGRPFAERPEDEQEMARDDEVQVTPGLSLEASTRAETFELGEPLYLRLTLRNTSDATLRVNPLLSISAGTVEVRITGPTNREQHFRPVVTTCQEVAAVELRPGAEILASEPIFFGAKGHAFPAAGTYHIRATYRATGNGSPVVATSKQHSIVVTPPNSAADVDVADALASPSAALYLILRGGDHLLAAEAVLGRIVDEAPQRAVAQHARLALATQALRPHSRDPGKARKLLEGVRPEALDWTHRAERLRLLGLAGAYAGNDHELNSAMQEFEQLARVSRPEAEGLARETADWIERSRKERAGGNR